MKTRTKTALGLTAGTFLAWALLERGPLRAGPSDVLNTQARGEGEPVLAPAPVGVEIRPGDQDGVSLTQGRARLNAPLDCDPIELLLEAYALLPGDSKKSLSSALLGSEPQTSAAWSAAAFACASRSLSPALRSGLEQRLIHLLLEEHLPIRQGFAIEALREHLRPQAAAWEWACTDPNLATIAEWELEVQIAWMHALPQLGLPLPGSIEEGIFNACLYLAAQHPEPDDWDSPSFYARIARMVDADYALQVAKALLRDHRIAPHDIGDLAANRVEGTPACGALRMLEVLVDGGEVSFEHAFAQIEGYSLEGFLEIGGFRGRLTLLLEAGLRGGSNKPMELCFRWLDDGSYSGDEIAWLLSTSEVPESSHLHALVRERANQALAQGADTLIMTLGMVRKLPSSMRPSMDTLMRVVRDSRGADTYPEALFTVGCLQSRTGGVNRILSEEWEFAESMEFKYAILRVANRLRSSVGSRAAVDFLIDVRDNPSESAELQEWVSDLLAR